MHQFKVGDRVMVSKVIGRNDCYYRKFASGYVERAYNVGTKDEHYLVKFTDGPFNNSCGDACWCVTAEELKPVVRRKWGCHKSIQSR